MERKEVVWRKPVIAMNIVDKRFYEWTKGLSPEEARLSIFEKIRDIPYAVVPGMFGAKEGPEVMLQINKGFCDPKHYLLGALYERLNIPVRYCTYMFHWKDLDVDYPQVLKDLIQRISFSYHLACQVFVEDKWIVVDASWDSSLNDAGFNVNNIWDGKSDMSLAVKSVDGFVHNTAKERNQFLNSRMFGYSLPEKLAFSRFSIKLNKWLSDVRKEKKGGTE